MCLARLSRTMRSQHLVHDAPRLGLVGGHEVVAVGVVGDALERAARRLGEDAVEHLLQAQDLPRGDLDVARLALRAAPRLLWG